MNKKIVFPFCFVLALFVTGCGNSGREDKPRPLSTSDLAGETTGNTEKSTGTIKTSAVNDKINKEELEVKIQSNTGAKVFKDYCVSCHQADGSGVPGMYPPLKPNEYIENKDKFIEIVLNGMKGKIEVNGKTYNNFMAPHSHLSDHEISAVISYVRSGFGNNLGPVTAEEVASARKKMSN